MPSPVAPAEPKPDPKLLADVDTLVLTASVDAAPERENETVDVNAVLQDPRLSAELRDSLSEALADTRLSADLVQTVVAEVVKEHVENEKAEDKVDDPSQSARAFYVSSPEPKD